MKINTEKVRTYFVTLTETEAQNLLSLICLLDNVEISDKFRPTKIQVKMLTDLRQIMLAIGLTIKDSE